MGAYTGKRAVGFVLRDGRVVHTVDQGEFAGGSINSGDLLCKDAQQFEPFSIWGPAANMRGGTLSLVA